MLATLDKFGRILIPKKVREHLRIKPDSELQIIDDGERIILEPIREQEAITEKDGILIFTGICDTDLNQLLDNNREKRANKLMLT